MKIVEIFSKIPALLPAYGENGYSCSRSGSRGRNCLDAGARAAQRSTGPATLVLSMCNTE
jgi:hypothetical protein